MCSCHEIGHFTFLRIRAPCASLGEVQFASCKDSGGQEFNRKGFTNLETRICCQEDVNSQNFVVALAGNQRKHRRHSAHADPEDAAAGLENHNFLHHCFRWFPAFMKWLPTSTASCLVMSGDPPKEAPSDPAESKEAGEAAKAPAKAKAAADEMPDADSDDEKKPQPVAAEPDAKENRDCWNRWMIFNRWIFVWNFLKP